MYLGIFLIYVTFLQVFRCEDVTIEPVQKETKFDFNMYVNRLKKYGNFEPFRTYIETPDSDLFINADCLGEKPSKFVNYTELIAPLFNNWDERIFIDNLLSSFTYVDKVELINNEEVTKRTNLRSFIKEKKKNPTSVELLMPGFLK